MAKQTYTRSEAEKRRRDEETYLRQLVQSGMTASGRKLEDTLTMPKNADERYGSYISKYRDMTTGGKNDYDTIRDARQDAFYARNYLQQNMETYDAENGAGATKRMLDYLSSTLGELDDIQKRRVEKEMQEQRAQTQKNYERSQLRKAALAQTQGDTSTGIWGNLKKDDDDASATDEALARLIADQGGSKDLTRSNTVQIGRRRTIGDSGSGAISATAAPTSTARQAATTMGTPMREQTEQQDTTRPAYANSNWSDYIEQQSTANQYNPYEDEKNPQTAAMRSAFEQEAAEKYRQSNVLADYVRSRTQTAINNNFEGAPSFEDDPNVLKTTPTNRDNLLTKPTSWAAGASITPFSSTSDDGVTNRKLALLDDDMYRQYFDVLNQHGQETADEWLNGWVSNERLTQSDVERARSFAEKHPTLAASATFADRLLSPFQSGGVAGVAIDRLLGKEVDEYDPRLIQARQWGAVDEAVNQNVQENWGETGAFLYGAATSAMQSIGNVLMYGGTGSLANMSRQAAEGAYVDALDRGATTDQALTMAGVSAVAEAIFEKFSIDNLIGMAKGGGLKAAAVNVLRQMGVEGSEEAATEVSTIIADYLIMNENSRYNMAANARMAAGEGADEARRNAIGDMALDVGRAALAGAVSGGISGGAMEIGTHARGGRTQNFRQGQNEEWTRPETAQGFTQQEAQRLLGEGTPQEASQQNPILPTDDTRTGLRTDVPVEALPVEQVPVEDLPVEQVQVEEPVEEPVLTEQEADDTGRDAQAEVETTSAESRIAQIEKESGIIPAAYKDIRDNDVSLSDYYNDYITMYEAGLEGKPYDEIKGLATHISYDTKMDAYFNGERVRDNKEKLELTASKFDEKTASAYKANFEDNRHMTMAHYYAQFLSMYSEAKRGRSYEDSAGVKDNIVWKISEGAKMAAWNAGHAAFERYQQAQAPASVTTAQEAPASVTPAQEDTTDVATESAAASTPSAALAETLLTKYIDKGTAFNSAVLFEAANKAFGGTQAEGTYTPKDAYDAMELAVNKRAGTMVENLNGSAKDAVRAINKLENMLEKLPTQTKRTQEQQDYQQFSTPPTIAYVAAWAANISNADTVLEPSAGVGGIATFAKAFGATVYANELSPRRAALLNEMGFDGVFQENAEQLNNVLPDSVQPTVVLMNPPFSATAGRMKSNSTKNAQRHVEQALLRLKDGGRLVAIVGHSMTDDSPSHKAWYEKIRQSYDVRAMITIDGKNYKKYGTTWDIMMMVVDKTGAQKGETLKATYESIKDVPKALEGIRNDRSRLEASGGTEQDTAVTVGEAGVAASGVREKGRAVRVSTSAGVGELGTTGGTVSRTDGDQPVRATGADSVRAVQPEVVRDADDGNRRGRDGSDVDGSATSVSQSTQEKSAGDQRSDTDSRGTDTGDSALRDDKQPVRKRAVKDNGIYAEYVPAPLPMKGAKKHPAPLVESAAMAAVQSPKATYVPNLPDEIIKSGALSAAQLENIVYAGQAHSQMLPSGERKGYFIGDGTGVGKGRQISGIILDNFRQGRKKALWVSVNSSLYEDAVRDWKDLGGDPKLVKPQSKFGIGKPIDMKEGILFTGYSTLRSGKGVQTRLQQIVDWLGDDFDGVIAMDEAHSMGNLLGKTGARGATKGSAAAFSGAELQKKLPNARVVYVSATAATDVSELAYAERLGLWGKGTAFNTVNEFVEQIGSSGISAMELVARDMKAMGVYLARSISYDGVVYDTLQHTLSPIQRAIYDTMSEAWQVTLKNMKEALQVTSAHLNSNERGRAKSAYYGAMQNFYNQILTSMGMPSVIADMKKELAAGHSCVLQIVNTNEAETKRQLADAKKTNKDLDDIDLTPRGAILHYLENAFPTQAFEEYEDDKGKKQSRPVVDSQGNAVQDKQAIALRDDLIARIKEISIPDGPLEMLYDAFGVEQVAEMTGRSTRVVPKKNERGQMVRVEENLTANHKLADVDAFQNGDKRILVFSNAGGTGKSYHADKRAKNQQQRIHYLIQPGWSASKATQGFGRTHRSNQVNTPVFKLVTTDVMGQKRFVSTIARRLDQLGALTKGQRETGGGMFGAKDNLESPLAKDSLYSFYYGIVHGRIPGLDGRTILDKMGLLENFTDEYGRLKMDDGTARNMNMFLNRVLALTVDEQNEVFGAFYALFEEAYDNAIQKGTLDMGMETVKADKIEILDDRAVRTNENTGEETRYVQAKMYRKPMLIKTADALSRVREHFIGVFETDDGRTVGVFQTADKTGSDGRVHKQYKIQSPTYSKFGTWNEETLAKRATAIKRKDWNEAWAKEVAAQPEYTESVTHMLTGTLLPVWDLLPKEGNTKAMRIIADDGRQYLGRVIEESQIDAVLHRLGSDGRNKDNDKETPEAMMKRILNGETLRISMYSGRATLSRSRVSGEYRIELKGQNPWYFKSGFPGIIIETIASQQRYFVPTGAKGVAILKKIKDDDLIRGFDEASDEEFSRELRMNRPGENTHEAEWTAERAGDQGRERIGIDDIIGKIRHGFGIPVTGGHVRGAGIRGVYNRSAMGIRTRMVNDLPIVSHELGHHLNNTYHVIDDMSASAVAELERMLPVGTREEYGDNIGVLRSESFAEFVRKYLQNHETAAIDYPEVTDALRNSLDADALAMLDELSDDVNAYYSLSANDAQEDIRLRKEKPKDYRTLREKMRDFHDRIYLAWVDTNHGIKRFDDATGAQAYKLATNSAYADAVAWQVLTGDLTNQDGQKVSDGLQNALDGINLKDDKEYKLFNEYLVVRHAPERLREGMRIFANDKKNSSVWMHRRQQQLEQEYPNFKAAADRLYTFQRAFLQTWGVDTGLVSAEAATAWAKRWKNYVPLNRVMDDVDSYGMGARRGYANQNSTIRRARGSSRVIMAPVENIVNNVTKMINAAQRNQVMATIVRAAHDVPNSARFLEAIPDPLVPKRTNLRDVKHELGQRVEAAGLDPTSAEAVSQMIEEIDDVLLQFQRGRAKDDVVTVLLNGRPQFYKVNDPLLLKSVANMNPKRSNDLLEAYGRITRAITGNITGHNVVWSVMSNAPRDLMTLFTYSKDKNPAHMFGGIASAYVNKVRGNDADPMYKEYLAMGGGKTSAYTADKNLQARVRKTLAGDKKHYLNPLEWLDYVSDLVESGPRYATYKAMRERGMTPQEAFYESNDITVNFRRGGTGARTANKFIPFFNAGVQGLDKFVRWATANDATPGNRGKASAARLSMFALVSLIAAGLSYAMNMHDDEDKKNYERLSTYTKNSFFCIPLGNGEYLTIPKSREITVLSSLFETMIEYTQGNEHAFDEFYDYAVNAFLPNVASDIAKGDMLGMVGNLGLVGTLSNVYANKDFLGRPIVSASLEKLEPRDQYTARTSKLAKAMGAAFNISPEMIDYVGENTLGGFWKWNEALFPVGEENVDYSLGIGRSYVRDSLFSTDIVNRAYNLLDAAGQEKESAELNNAADVMEKTCNYKWLTLSTTFYTRYNKLSKNEPDTKEARGVRATVLDMLDGVNDVAQGINKNETVLALEELATKTGDTAFFPATMQDYIKDEDNVKHPLTSAQYVDYQTDYLTRYYGYAQALIEQGGLTVGGMTEVKKQAKLEADARMITDLGYTSADAQKLQTYEAAGIDGQTRVVFENGLTQARADGSNVTNEELREVLNRMDITDAQRSVLYQSKADGVAGNVYASVEELNRWIYTKDEDALDGVKRSLTDVYKPMVIFNYISGNDIENEKILMKLEQLALYDDNDKAYYTWERFDKWIKDYEKDYAKQK